MANLKIFTPGGIYALDIETNYTPKNMDLAAHNKTVCTYVDSESGFEVTLTGGNFKYAGGHLTGGNVKEVAFNGAGEDPFATITDFNLLASKLDAAVLGKAGVSGLLSKLLEHDDILLGTAETDILAGEGGEDVIRGRGGNDYINGNSGNDRLFGGAGDDTFQYFGGGETNGDDMIKDYQTGNEMHHDTIFVRFSSFSFARQGGDTRIDFEDGSSVLIEGVAFGDRSDIHVDAIV